MNLIKKRDDHKRLKIPSFNAFNAPILNKTVINATLLMGSLFVAQVSSAFNIEISQLMDNNNAYSDQGVLMEWSGSINTNGHTYTSFGSSNFLNSPAFVNYYNAQVDHVIYFGGIGANSQSYAEYNTDPKPGVFEHNEVVQNLLPKKAGVTLHEDDPNAINHAFKPGSTGNSYDSDADYIMIGDTFAIGYVLYKPGGPVASLQQIFLPQGYVSGTTLSGSLFLRGETLDGLGIADGFNENIELNGNGIVLASLLQTYANFGFDVFHDENGNPGTSVSVEIETPIPEPSSYALILGAFLFGGLLLRKRVQR
jgi:hypothetical protein